MFIANRYARISLCLLPLACSVVMLIEGCQNAGERTAAAEGRSLSSSQTSDVMLGATGLMQSSGQTDDNAPSQSTKGAAQLWTENCIRCHNARDPRTYTDGEWAVVMHHMRVRANLTAEEHRAILEYLKASN